VARGLDHDQDAIEVSDYVSRYIKPRLSTLPGAADVRVFGERQISMRIWLDPAKLAAYRVTPQDVEEALRRQNVEIPPGASRATSASSRCSRRPTCRRPRNSTPS
jgi:multidrug efflux pump subunit AcrB